MKRANSWSTQQRIPLSPRTTSKVRNLPYIAWSRSTTFAPSPLAMAQDRARRTRSSEGSCASIRPENPFQLAMVVRKTEPRLKLTRFRQMLLPPLPPMTAARVYLPSCLLFLRYNPTGERPGHANLLVTIHGKLNEVSPFLMRLNFSTRPTSRRLQQNALVRDRLRWWPALRRLKGSEPLQRSHRQNLLHPRSDRSKGRGRI